MGLTPEEEFSERYESICRQFFGDQRVHVNVAWRLAQNVSRGDFVMFLPIEITEQIEGMIPRVAQVQQILRINTDEIRLLTNQGVMSFHENDEVQVVV